MTNEKINTAIAEACGWTDCEYVKSLGLCKGRNSHLVPQYETGHSIIPNYCNDLNAMHEAEKKMKPSDLTSYLKMLFDCLGADCVCASASIRAKLFVKTLGKWEDEA